MREYLSISPEVKAALQDNRPVVALESTIISHGMPYPQNVETAIEVERIARETGVVPATIAIINGRLKVGLTKEEIDYLGQEGFAVNKTSRRDIPFMVANKQDGATTVASTMIIADMAGIRIFATGGIGGVHRGAEKTMDVSADLQELARTNVAVVCAGVKSILDIGLTIEYLETHGVPVIGFGTEEFPAFYAKGSGFKANYRVDTGEEIARVMKAKWDLDLQGGLVIGNPIPDDYAMEGAKIQKTIDEALRQATESGIKGKEVTPFLLSKIKELTGGESLNANIQLVYNNVKVASELAKAFSTLNHLDEKKFKMA